MVVDQDAERKLNGGGVVLEAPIGMTLRRIRTQRHPHSPKGTRERYATLGGVPFQTLVQRGGNAGEQSLAGVGGGRGAVVSLDVWTEEGETSEGRADAVRAGQHHTCP